MARARAAVSAAPGVPLWQESPQVGARTASHNEGDMESYWFTAQPQASPVFTRTEGNPLNCAEIINEKS